MSRRTPITGHDLMDSNEVADAFGVTRSTLLVAMSKPEVVPTLAAQLPEPIRKIGQTHVWLRDDIERAVKAREKAKVKS